MLLLQLKQLEEILILFDIENISKHGVAFFLPVSLLFEELEMVLEILYDFRFLLFLGLLLGFHLAVLLGLFFDLFFASFFLVNDDVWLWFTLI